MTQRFTPGGGKSATVNGLAKWQYGRRGELLSARGALLQIDVFGCRSNIGEVAVASQMERAEVEVPTDREDGCRLR
jgi:hypothetical protein